ncbi:MAG: ERAD-associated protein [Pycnora praestabilis]|nr:MAG: ERAD-associated protein [Pycnora praestabilis]
MKERLWRLLPLAILLISTLFVLVGAQQENVPQHGTLAVGVTQPTDESEPAQEHLIPQSFLHNQRSREDGNVEGSFAVDEARSILRTLKPPKNRLKHYNKPSGFVGTTFYYAKEAFYLLFMNGPSQQEMPDIEQGRPKLGRTLAKAVKLLEGAAIDNNSDAIYLLAEMNFYGNYSHPRDYNEAFRRYHELSSLTGNSSAQHMIGFMYGTGIGNVVERDQANALLYHTFAALGGDTRSEMTVAFRHHTGIATPRTCDEAAFYYKKVADKAIQYARSGPPGGQALVREAYRLADEDGGVYGEGASVTSSGANANKGGPNSDSHAAFDDVLEYLDLMSRKGDLKATFSLGRLHYEGSRVLHRNLRKARKYFMLIANRYWGRDGKIIIGGPNDIEKLASKAAGYIGRMFLRGEGVEQSFEKAMTWFNRGKVNGEALCQYGLGLMYLHGHGVPKNAMKAADYFKAAADQDFASSQVRLGALFLDQGDIHIAMRYFELAARHGHIEAFYYLAEISNQGVGRDRSCGMATAYYKIVAEKAELIHTSFIEGNEAYEDGDVETALVDYMMAAEQGYEVGQANVAYLLDEQKSRVPLDSLIPFTKRRPSLLRNAALALIYWTRSAKQSNVDSMVKMGDYYLSGYGIDADAERAAACYQAAAEFQQSAQALWNLGWMHENGVGVEQDFHLAKRFYDQALETNEESYLPVKLGLLKLRMRSFWNTITNGRVNSIRSEPEPKSDWSFNSWIANFFEDDHPYYHSSDPSDDPTSDDLSDPTSNIQHHDAIPGGDDYYDEVDEGIVESLIIVALAGALAFLVYYRHQRQLLHRRAAHGQGRGQPQGQGEQAAQAQGQGRVQDGGFFPQPGDPDFNQWVAGGVGH